MDNAAEMISKMVEIERRYDMFSKQVKGVSYWIFLRRWLVVDLKSSKNNQTSADIKGKQNIRSKMRIAASLLRNSYFRHYAVPKKTRVLISSHPRRVLYDGKYECSYTSLLAGAMPDSLLLERPDPYEHLSPIPEKSIMYVDRSIVESNIYWKWNSLFRKSSLRRLKAKVLEQIGPVLEEINRVFGVSFSTEHYAASVCRHVMLYYSKRKYYDKLIRRIKPGVIVEVVSYLPENLILNELGKKYRIPTIELQHGIIDATHPAYNFGNKIALAQLPDYLFVFSDYWKAMVPPTFSPEQVKVTGYPFFERDIVKYTQKGKSGSIQAVCFISQWTIGAQLSQLALKVKQELEKQGKTITIYYKLHPGEFKDWKEKYPWLADSGIQVIGAGDMSLYEMFACSQIQVGVASTAVYEGLGFGLGTYIYQISDSEMFNGICNKGYAKFIHNAEQLCQEILHPDEKLQGKGQTFWKMNSLETMVTEIRKIEKLSLEKNLAE